MNKCMNRGVIFELDCFEGYPAYSAMASKFWRASSAVPMGVARRGIPLHCVTASTSSPFEFVETAAILHFIINVARMTYFVNNIFSFPGEIEPTRPNAEAHLKIYTHLSMMTNK